MADSSMNYGNFTTTMVCYLIPPKTNSHGVLAKVKHPLNFLTYTLPLLELQMGLIFIISYSIHYLLKRIGVSFFVSCAIAGIILSPTTYLGRWKMMKKVIFPQESQDTINTVALLGYNMFLFLSAVKMDVAMIKRKGERALAIGITLVIIPLVFGLVYLKFTAKSFVNNQEIHGSWIVMIATSLTSFPVIAYLVGHQLRIKNSELGRLALFSALIADILGIFSTVLLVLLKKGTLAGAIKNFTPLFIFLLVLLFMLRPTMLWVIKQTKENKPVDAFYINIIMALGIGSEAYFELFYQQLRFLGPFIFGLFVPAGPPLGSALDEKYSSFASGVLLNILVSTSMMRANLWLLITKFTKLKKYLFIIFIVNGVKMLSSLAPSLFSKMSLVDSVALSFIMNYKGIVELCMCVAFRDTRIISEEIFALLAVYILCNAIIVPVLVKCLYDPSRRFAIYKARNIMSLKPSSEFRILACIHKPDNVDSVIKLLDTSYPTKESPISVCVLHLIKLIGQSTPIFISHQKQKPVSHSTSQNVIHAFNQFEKNNWNVLSVHTFTSISSSKLMYEDICTLALNKLTSLILIPLHRRWSIHGTIESEDTHLRSLNCNVLEKAPCSVGIFFDRGRLGRQTSKTKEMSILSVCMIFLGGKDDREALILAKRMANKSSTILTVVHFIGSKDNEMIESEDRLMDNKVLDDFKEMACRDEFIVYQEQVVNEGRETVFFIRSMANEFDLFLMGRRYGINCQQTIGLCEWSELPELGVIGDLFASRDLKTRASILIVQQQKNKLNN